MALPTGSLRLRILLLVIPLNLAVATIYVVWMASIQQALALERTDARLLRAAIDLHEFLEQRRFGDGFHEGVLKGEVVLSEADHLQVVHQLIGFANERGLVYAYSVVQDGETFRFPVGSATPDELARETYDKFMGLYRDPPAALGRAAATSQPQFDTYVDDYGRFRSVFVPFRTPGGAQYLLGVDLATQEVDRQAWTAVLLATALGLGFLVAIATLSIVLVNRMARPIDAVSEYAGELVNTHLHPPADLEARVRAVGEHRRDEIGTLARTMLYMVDELKTYVRSLTETTAAKERIESELQLAEKIQRNLLPRLFPAFPDHAEFEIHASMDPARQVGGDFYDFFLVDERTLCFLIADVSDKGVPAALYMTVAKTLLKTEALRGLPPEQILQRVNAALALDNDGCMFVTVFCAVLDTVTGEVSFATAGHNPPVLWAADGACRFLDVHAGLMLGPFSETSYTRQTIQLSRDDVLFLYTDGVTEATNAAGDMFGNPRLLDVVRTHPTRDVAGLVTHVAAAVETFVAGAPQSDDVTLLALRFKGVSRPRPEGDAAISA